MALIGFEHVGLTVSNIDQSLAFYVDLLGLKLVVRRPGQGGGSELCFLDVGNCMLEIMGPATGALLAEDVADGRAGVRHLTFTFDDLDEVFARIQAADIEVVEPPRRAYNRDIVDRVAFCRDPDGILIELCERTT